MELADRTASPDMQLPQGLRRTGDTACPLPAFGRMREDDFRSALTLQLGELRGRRAGPAARSF
jgi:hypothetical protein